MEPIKETIREVMVRLKTKNKKDPQDDMRALLKKILTKKEKEHAGFAYFNKGTLSLNVDSSVWLYQLSLQKEKLLMKLRKKSSKIKDIMFRIGDTSGKE